MEYSNLCIDAGGMRGRAVISTLSGGKISFTDLLSWDNSPVFKDGCLCYNFDLIADKVYEAVKLAAGYNIESIGICGRGSEYGFISKGRLTGNIIHYADTSCDNIFDKFSQKSQLYTLTGVKPVSSCALFRLIGDKRKGYADKADKLLFLPDLIAYHLTGEYHCEKSAASCSSLLCKDGNGWNYALTDKLGLKRSLFPRITENCSVYGYLTEDICYTLKSECLPVISVCSRDIACAASICHEDNLFVFLGAYCYVGETREEPDTSDPVFTNERGLNSCVLRYAFSSGLILLKKLEKSLSERGEEVDFSDMEDMCNLIGARIIDISHPAFLSDDDIIESIKAYCESTDQQPPEETGEFIGTIYLSVVMKIRSFFEKTKGFYKGVELMGEGVKSPVFCQLISNALSLPLTCSSSDPVLSGNAMIQYFSTGKFKDIAAARESVLSDFKTYYPTGDTDDIYDLYKSITNIG